MKLLKHISTIVLSFYLILTMGGLSIFHHMCSCNSSVTTSVLVESSCCSNNNHESLACHSESEHNSCSDSSCNDCNCETEVEYLSISETLTVDHYRITPSSFTFLSALKSFLAINSTETTDRVNNPVFFEDTSPPLSGKYIVILHQSLKIPSLIS